MTEEERRKSNRDYERAVNKELIDIKIKDLEGHAEVANREMGVVKETLGVIQTDIKWLKDGFNKNCEKIDSLVVKAAWIGGAIAVISFVMPLISPLITKHL